MFPEGSRFMQDINKVVDIFPEEKYDEVLKSAEGKPKMDNASTEINRLVMYFYDNTYKSVIF